MALSPNRPRKLPGVVLFIVLCVISIALMTVWAREGSSGPLHSFRSGTELVTAPIKNIGTVLGTPFRAIGDFVTGTYISRQTVEELEAENETLRSQVIRMEEYRQEAERLNGVLELRDAYQLESVAARVIGTSSDTWNQIITINKGTNSGFAVGMPVMSANGLIGQIESVSPTSSVVRLITDEKSGVSVFVQSNRAEGVLTGSVDGVLYLEFIETSVEVAVGDTIITSGSGGVFPKGIPIGEVISVEQAPSDVYKTIIVRPISRVATYEEVLVITGTEAEIAGAGTPDASDENATDPNADGTDGTDGGAQSNTAAGGSDE